MDFPHFLRRVGNTVRRARWASGLTQQDLAEAALTFRLLSGLERGQGNPSLKTLFKLAQKLKVSVAELVDVEGEHPTREPLAERKLNPPKRGRKPKARRIPKRRKT